MTWFDAKLTVPTGPNANRDVLVTDGETIGVGRVNGGVTHWAELPDPPPKPKFIYRPGGEYTTANGLKVTLVNDIVPGRVFGTMGKIVLTCGVWDIITGKCVSPPDLPQWDLH